MYRLAYGTYGRMYRLPSGTAGTYGISGTFSTHPYVGSHMAYTAYT